MIIGIDGNEANISHRVGIGEYAYELLKQFNQVHGSPTRGLPSQKGRQFTVHSKKVQFKIYLKKPPITDMPGESESWQYVVVGPRKFWTQFGLPFNLYSSKQKPDVFFSPSHYAPRFCPIPNAISIMDVSYLHFPEMFNKRDLYQLVHWTKYSARNANKIFTISTSSKNDIIKHYGVKPENVVVTYPGIKRMSNTTIALNATNVKYQMSNIEKLQEKFHISKNYILFVGTLQPRKNIVRLIEAFSRVKGKGERVKNLELVIVGKRGWQYEEILDAPRRFGIEDNVKFLDFVSDEDLPNLYRYAECYILPSLYEGFGLPVLEAMQYDCPVITSNVSSLPEAAGDAALYVDPKNVEDIVAKLEQLVGNEKLRKELIEKGRKQVKKFSWEKAARETLGVLEELGSH